MTLAIPLPNGTARDLLSMLRKHYLPEYRLPSGIFIPEIQAPGSLRRADLLWQGVTLRDRRLIGHEIKISRQDLKHELDDPEKCVPWKRYCDEWWLVVPHAEILKGMDIPEEWGIMLPPSGRRTRTMTIHRKATVLTPEPKWPAMETIAIWLFWRQEALQREQAADRRYIKSLQSDVERLRNELRGELTS